jgi:hypothetical protein
MTIFGFLKYNLNMQIQLQDLAAKIKTIGLISKKKKKVYSYLVIMYLLMIITPREGLYKRIGV